MSRQEGDEAVFAHVKFNVSELLGLAERLRNIPCTCDLSQRPRTGSFNWAIFLRFDDGVEWVFRSPRKSHGLLDEETASLLLASEAATLRYIGQNSSIPVPEVFYYRYLTALECQSFIIFMLSETKRYRVQRNRDSVYSNEQGTRLPTQLP
jgi:hypothetical protein